VTQWAAVRTHWVPMRAPPQRYWLRELMRATCQHHSFASASSPPTTLAPRSSIRAWMGARDVPFTPHTYLLYTGLLAVVVVVVVVPIVVVSSALGTKAIRLSWRGGRRRGGGEGGRRMEAEGGREAVLFHFVGYTHTHTHTHTLSGNTYAT
jgi:hypothetical protein